MGKEPETRPETTGATGSEGTDQQESRQDSDDSKRKLTESEEKRISESREKALNIRKTREDNKKGEKEEGRMRNEPSTKPNFDQEEDDDEWQMECNQGQDVGGTANQPPDDHEGMDVAGWLATTTRPKWLTNDSSHGRQETGKQIRKRIVKQRKDQQDKVTDEGMQRGSRSEKLQLLRAKTRSRLGTTDQGGGRTSNPSPLTKMFTKTTHDF